MKKVKYTTISMPIKLHRKVEKLIEDTGFGSVSGFVNFVMRSIVSGGSLKEKDQLTEGEVRKVRERLRALGYLE